MKNVGSGTNRQESNKMPQEHLRHPSTVNENVGDEMHSMVDSITRDYLDMESLGSPTGDEPNTPQSDDDLVFVNGKSEPDKDFDARQLWDYFHPFCGYGAHPMRLGPFQYGGIRGNGLEAQHVDAHKTYHGYTRYPELREEWVEPDDAAPLGFTEADFALHFGPRPQLDEDELGDKFIDDLRLPEALQLPYWSRSARTLDHEADSPTQDFAPLPTTSPISPNSTFPRYLPERPAPRPPYTRGAPPSSRVPRPSRPLRQSNPVSQVRNMPGQSGFRRYGNGRNNLRRDQNPFDNARNPFTDDFNIDDFRYQSRGLDSHELGDIGSAGFHRSSRQDQIRALQSRGAHRQMRAMDAVGCNSNEWPGSHIPDHVLAYNSFYGTGR